ncbi:unnamed protein product [Fusarium venenatum]|uniref:Uncharacterized protein n=1 Tax=Fusarium venenatum TaxID=56646 RepID=A0A2L2TW91_9HYPO|nr:uncharacterized protein FVRRES_10264 [Fusarium venenatum]CEI70187.1 unnamed protein product [Fusarium venenatum]
MDRKQDEEADSTDLVLSMLRLVMRTPCLFRGTKGWTLESYNEMSIRKRIWREDSNPGPTLMLTPLEEEGTGTDTWKRYFLSSVMDLSIMVAQGRNALLFSFHFPSAYTLRH